LLLSGLIRHWSIVISHSTMSPIELGLPHRDPFVFVDEVTQHVPGESAVGVKTFAGDEPMFAGHFPGNPLVPGVILTEALAQMAGIAGGGDGRLFLLSAIRSVKFPSAARPGECVDLSAKKIGSMGRLWIFDVRARVGERIVAEGQVVLNETG
jgi:3-hydroxyacyl-[acyl-carrier-protein] dehydratase